MELKPHQITAIERTIAMGGLQALHHKVGTGKTFTFLAAFNYYRSLDPKLRLLVVCPINLIEKTWVDEIEKLRRENGWAFNWENLNNGQRFDRFARTDIFLANFEYLMGDAKFKKIIDMISVGTWMCVVDESSKMKNHQAKTVERLNGWWDKDPNDKSKRPRNVFFRGIRDFSKYRMIGSGTPAPNIEWEHWAQMYFLDPKILGDNFYAFRNRHFELRRGNQIAPGSFLNKAQLREYQRTGFKYAVVPDMREQMLEKMKPFCHVVDSLDGMPEEIDQFVLIEMSPEHRKVYNQMKNDYIAEVKREVDGKELSSFAVANVALTKFMKLRQITSGFVIDDQGNEVGFLKNNPKLAALEDRIEAIGNDQMMIWCQFGWEIDAVAKMLEDIGGGASFLHGGVKKENRGQQIDDFRSGKNRFFILHPMSAQYGLTLVNCHYQEFFSLSYSHEEYIQCRGRIARHGQKFECVYNHIFCKGTIDEDMYNILQGKATAAEVAKWYLKG